MSRPEGPRADAPVRDVYRVAIGVTLVLMLATAVFVSLEHSLPGPRWFQSKQTVFVAGSIGTEFIPLPVLEILPEIDPTRFPPPRIDEKTQALAGGWIDRYGFLERRNEDRTYPATNPELAALLKDDRELWALPVGFSLSNFRPFSPDPSPVRFVGLACAGCHSARLPDRGPSGKLVYGAGNSGLDLIGFFQAFRGVLLEKKVKTSVPEERRRPVSVTEGPDLDESDYEYALSLTSIKEARKKSKLRDLSLAEQAMIYAWLLGAQAQAEKTKMKYDLPATPEQLRTPDYNPIGPGRTEPFVTLDNEVLNLPAVHNRGFSKIPAVFREKDRPWAQFDGSVMQPRTRSGLAAMTAGGSVDNLGGLGIGRNILDAADYTVDELVGPKWADIFGSPPATASGEAEPGDAERARLSEAQRRGRDVYRESCARCHGRPDPANPDAWQWESSPDFAKIVPAIDPFQFPRDRWLKDWLAFEDRQEWRRQATDPERVSFRDASIMPYTLFTYFDRGHPIKTTGEYYPLDHPLYTDRKKIRNSGGYINAPLDSLFVRAPYLHNGSVPNLAQLLNLEPRPGTFVRGVNLYDEKNVGLVAPQDAPVPDPAKARPEDPLSWPFDTGAVGNLNTGHNYPWTFEDAKAHADELRDLLEYLKTL
jgi:mono/diheme cytochrome c family protein